ncbi:histidine phosphatase family protein [Adlercreutzia sp. R25]|uniref:Histidine phosphatase family protein n=1 Tax=Adlercreutzia shanghongiae TaxID=3111773 RepID=A0ABU6IV38_9ACTN|nr:MULTISPECIES: histidine phosphatase family protein [unclassified Adlercreutzia]MEC4271968.1 histidine phosphatase family protein [Adlercreutzia sp. R25]MEC4293699.1 histidine phosphatase family protein [Adlercreutzia sp. R22]
MTVTFYFARHGETLFNVRSLVQGWCDAPLTSAGIYDAYKLGQGLAKVNFVGACVSDAGRAQDTLSIALEARENERVRLQSGLPIPSDQVKADALDELFGWGIADEEDRTLAIEEFLRSRGCLRPHSLVADSDRTPPADERWLALSEGWEPAMDELEWVDYPAYALATHRFGPRLAAPLPVRTDTRLREWCFGDLEGEPALRMRNRLFDLFGDDLPRQDQNRRLDEIADYLAKRDSTRRAENFAAIAGRIGSFLEDCGRSVERRGGGNVLVVSHALLIRSVVFLYARDRVGDSPKIKNGSVTEVVWNDGVIAVGPIGVAPSELF